MNLFGLSFLLFRLTELYQDTYEGNDILPLWLTESKTSLIAKNEQTKNAKNYRPIACLNLTYKVYTSCLKIFLTDPCDQNNIIASEQAADKKGVWGCVKQLLLNKAVMSKVKKKRRNIFTVWLDYKEAFDSVPHEQLLYVLQIAKVPAQLTEEIKHLTNQWSTVLDIIGETETIICAVINFFKGIFQGDSLSVLLFILTVNPLSFMLKNLKGYSYGTDRNSNITHNFFVDDLKLCASNINILKKQLDLVTTFSKDIGMTFGEYKCAYQQVENVKLKHQRFRNEQPLNQTN